MKKYSNIPLKERKRNADKVHRHEERLENLWWKRFDKQFEEEEQAILSDKERQEVEAFERLKALAERKANSDAAD